MKHLDSPKPSKFMKDKGLPISHFLICISMYIIYKVIGDLSTSNDDRS